MMICNKCDFNKIFKTSYTYNVQLYIRMDEHK